MHAVPRDLLASSSLSEADTAAVGLLANLASDCFAPPFFSSQFHLLATVLGCLDSQHCRESNGGHGDLHQAGSLCVL